MLSLTLIIIICIIVQYILILTHAKKCINITCIEHKTKNNMYEHIEDIFSNIRTIQSTNNGYDFEMNKLLNIIDDVKSKENDTYGCIHTKQFLG